MASSTASCGGARPMRADARRNRARLVEVARQLIAEQGVEVSLEEVARRAGVGIGTLYRHFPARADLLQAVLADRYDVLAARAEELVDCEDPAASVDLWVRAFLEHVSTSRGLAAVVKQGVVDEATPLHASARRMQEAVERLLARAQRAGRVRADVCFKDVCMLAAGVAWGHEQHGSDEQRLERLLSVVLSGLRSSP